MMNGASEIGRNNADAFKLSKILIFSFFVLMTGMYICPEKIKLFCLIYVFILFVYFLCNFSLRIAVNPTILAWAAFCILGVLFCTVWNYKNLGGAIEFVVSIFIGLLTQIFCRDLKTKKRLMYMILAVSIIAFIGCIIQLIAPEILLKLNPITLGAEKYNIFYSFYKGNFLVGFSYQTGVTGYYLGVLAGFILCFWLFDNNLSKGKKILLALLFAVCFVFILLTAKRSVLLLVAVLAYALICYRNKKNIVKVFGVTALMGIALLLLLLFTDMGRSLLARTFGSSPLTGRDVIYAQLFDMIKAKPIFGYGFGGTVEMIKGFTNGHNIYFQVLAENGIVGFIIIMSIFIYNMVISFKAFKNVDQDNKKTVLICIYLQLFFLGMGFFGNPLYDIYPVVIYMIAVGIVQNISMRGINNERAVDI